MIYFLVMSLRLILIQVSTKILFAFSRCAIIGFISIVLTILDFNIESKLFQDIS
jgi:hypothetical protein